MKPGDLVKFTVKVYNDLGIGFILNEYTINGEPSDYYTVLTQQGVQVLSRLFMEIIE